MRRAPPSFMWKDVGLIGLVEAGLLLLVPPTGDFPLNDDWAYAHMVRDLLATGTLKVSDWSTAAAVLPTYWGALFCLPAGFSHTALRFSTLTLGYVGAVALYGVLAELRMGRWRALAGALLLLLNPLYLNLSYTFMTDVPFCSLMLVALWLYLRGLSGEISSLWLGSIAVAAALLCRQVGVVLCLAPAIALWMQRRERPLRWLHVAAVAFIPLVVFLLYGWWITFVHGPTLALAIRFQEQRAFQSDAGWPAVVLERLAWSLLYGGWFVAPLGCSASLSREWWGLRERPRFHQVTILAVAGALLGLVGSDLVSSDPRRLLPYFENVIVPEGFCPTLLGGKQPVFPLWIWPGLTLLSALVVIGFAQTWCRAPRVSRGVAMVLFAALAIGAPTYAYVLFWDDYLLPFVPLTIATTLDVLRPLPLSRGRMILGLAAMGLFSLASQQEYLAWNAARWETGERLVRRGIPFTAIDGGFEWNGWFLFERGLKAVRHLEAARQDVWAWKLVLKPRYEIAFAPQPRRRIVETVPYRAWLPPRERTLFVLESSDPPRR